MDSSMHNQDVILRGGFSTVITGITSLSSMSPLVPKEVRFLSEGLSKFVAFIAYTSNYFSSAHESTHPDQTPPHIPPLCVAAFP